MIKKSFSYRGRFFAVAALVILGCGICTWAVKADVAPLTYLAYTGTDTKVIPPAPPLGPANSVFRDPTFGSRILRVTDQNTQAGQSFISTQSGFQRTFNANSTAIKLEGPHGDGYWLEFNPGAFAVGNGSSKPVPHQLSLGADWEWSAVNPDIIYFLNGNQIAKYDKSTQVTTNLGGPSNGDSVAYSAAVIGQDNWVCAAAGSGVQNTFTKIYCVNPANTSSFQFIDVYNKTINGVTATNLTNWPTSASGEVIGIHSISGGTGPKWLQVTFHGGNWGGNNDAIYNLETQKWSLLTNADPYWSGHISMGNGIYANGGGSKNTSDSRGFILRDPDNLMNSSAYRFIEQPPDTSNGWCDGEHSSWLNSASNPQAPILISRYTIAPPCQYAWTGEILLAAVDGSNQVWRVAHNHNAGYKCFYAGAFAQISGDGKWALFSSIWDGTLGPDNAFGCGTRIDTFIVDLTGASAASSSTMSPSTTPNTTNPTPASAPTTGTTAATASVSTAAPATPVYPRGGQSLTTITSVPMQVGSAEVLAPAGPSVPSGLAIFAYRKDGVLVSEAGVPGTAPALRGRIYVDVSGVVNTGLAIANENDSAATVSFFFTDGNGIDFGNGSITIPAHGQISSFLDEAPFNAPHPANGTFTFSSSVPVSAIAIRGLTNERSEFLTTTLPVANPDMSLYDSVYFSHFANGGGWTTQFVLVNPSDTTLTGTLSFSDQGTAGGAASSLTMNVDGAPVNQVTYSIPPRSSRRYSTVSVSSEVTIGSAQVTPNPSNSTPVGVAIFSFKNAGITVSEAGIPTMGAGSAFRMYAEADQTNAIRSGIAMRNAGFAETAVNFELTDLNGTSIGLSGNLVIPASGQRSLFLNQIPGFESLQTPFKGVLRISTAGANITVLGIRGRWNERRDFVFTTTPATNENGPAHSALVFPHIVNGGGYTTQFITFSGTPAEPTAGNLQLFSQSGGSLDIGMVQR